MLEEPQDVKRFAVLRRWKHNPNDFEVYECVASVKEAQDMIRQLPKSDEYRWEVGEYQ